MNAVEIENVTKSLGDFSVHDLTLSLPQGTVMGLVGENGAGKTTIVNMIMNALIPDRGHITVLGEDTQSERFTDVKQQISVIPDSPMFYGEFTPENIARIMELSYPNWDKDKFYEYLSRFRLPKNKKVKKFSKGMAMKLSASAALSHRSRLLILDEATSGLDPFIRDELLDIIYDYTRDERNSVLISSHIVSDLEKICDYIAFVHNGELMFCEEKDRLIDEYCIIKADEKMLLPPDSIRAIRRSRFGTDILVKKSLVPFRIDAGRPRLEDIIVFMVRAEKAAYRLSDENSGESIAVSSLW